MSRHQKMASDSARMCAVVPRSMIQQLSGIAIRRSETISNLIREYVTIGIEKDNKEDGK